MAADKEGTTTASLLTLPTEVRLMIYSHLAEERFLSHWRLRLNKTTVVLGPMASHLTSVNQLCRQTHGETKDMIYTDMIAILICENRGVCFWDILENSHARDDGWSSLSRMQRVELRVTVKGTNDRDHNGVELANASKILAILSQSSTLRAFCFMLTMHRPGKGEPEEFKKKKNQLRRETTRDGVKMGRTAVGRELDYAMKALEMFQEGCE